MLEGDLGDFTLPDILQLLAYTTKSGTLELHGPQAAGRIDVEDGRIRGASSDTAHQGLARRLLGSGRVPGDALRETMERHGRLPTDVELAEGLREAGLVDADAVSDLLREQVVDALFDLLRWETGGFRFRAATDPSEAPAGDPSWPVDELLAEAQRRVEEWPQVRERTGTGDAVVTMARPGDHHEPPDADGWELLALVDGHRTVDDLVALSGQGEFDTRQVLARLLDAGVVVVSEGEAPMDVRVVEHERLAELEARLAGAPAPAPPAAEPAPAAAQPAPASEESAAEEPGADAASGMLRDLLDDDIEPAAEEPGADEPAAEEHDADADETSDVLRDLLGEDLEPVPPPPPPPPPPGAREEESEVDEPTPWIASTDDVAPVEASEAPDEPADESAVDETAGDEAVPHVVADDEEDEEDEEAALREDASRAERLRRDPSVDENLIDRLIDGLERLP